MRHLIVEAIENKLLLTFTYEGRSRLVEPHALGNSSARGEATLCAWQLSGGSGTGFRYFHLSKMSQLSAADAEFPGPRPGYNRDDPGLSAVAACL